MKEPVPVVLFIYARSEHLSPVLASLRANKVPLLEVFADGPKNKVDEERVAQARQLIRAVDWCDVRLTERTSNLGLGHNILSGVSDVLTRSDTFIVWEDDLIAVPGTYVWTTAMLRLFADDERVMSVTAWNHPRITPQDIGAHPYFDGRAECWVWGAWSRSWQGMSSENAIVKLAAAARRGVKPDAYGSDLPVMAEAEVRQNTWAVRWLYHHLQRGGLCVRPPWSMVEHIGFDSSATNAKGATMWSNPALREAPPPPVEWFEPKEHPDCQRLWRAAFPSGWRSAWQVARRKLGLE